MQTYIHTAVNLNLDGNIPLLSSADVEVGKLFILLARLKFYFPPFPMFIKLGGWMALK